MNIVEVSVRIEGAIDPGWVVCFDSIPTLEKLREVARDTLMPNNYRRVLEVLKAAKPVMVANSRYPSQHTRWRTRVTVAGTYVGSIEYRQRSICSLEDNERAEGFSLGTPTKV